VFTRSTLHSTETLHTPDLHFLSEEDASEQPVRFVVLFLCRQKTVVFEIAIFDFLASWVFDHLLALQAAVS